MTEQLSISRTFVRAQNKYHKVYLGGRVEAKKYETLLQTHCDELTNLIDNGSLRSYFYQMKEYSLNIELREQALRMLRDYDEFCRLLYFEEKLLKQIGVSDAYANYLVSTMNLVQQKLESGLDELTNPDQLLEKFRNLANVSCAAADQVSNKSWLYLRADMGKRLVRIGGAVLISANGLAPSLFPEAGIPIYLASNAAGIAMTSV